MNEASFIYTAPKLFLLFILKLRLGDKEETELCLGLPVVASAADLSLLLCLIQQAGVYIVQHVLGWVGVGIKTWVRVGIWFRVRRLKLSR